MTVLVTERDEWLGRYDWLMNRANTNAGRMRIVRVSILDVRDDFEGLR
jgi:hypothetical protein